MGVLTPHPRSLRGILVEAVGGEVLFNLLGDGVLNFSDLRISNDIRGATHNPIII